MPIVISLILGAIWLASILYRAIYLGPFTWVQLGWYALGSYLVLCIITAIFFYVYYLIVKDREDK